MSFRKSVVAAKSSLEEEDFEGALGHVEAALRYNPTPDSAQFYLLHAKVSFHLENLEAAEQHLNKALNINPSFMPALTLLATLHKRNGKLQDYHNTLQKQRSIARDKGNAKKLEELSVLLFTSLAAGKEHAAALDVLEELWDLQVFENMSRSDVVAQRVRLTEEVAPGEFQSLISLRMLLLEETVQSSTAKELLEHVSTLLSLSLCCKDAAGVCAGTCRRCLELIPAEESSGKTLLARAVVLSTLVFLAAAVEGSGISSEEAEGYIETLLELDDPSVEVFSWRACTALAKLAMDEGDLDAARAWNDQAVSRWKSSTDPRNRFIQEYVEAPETKRKSRQGVSLTAETDPNAIARAKRKTLRVLLLNLLLEGSITMWFCRAHLLISTWIPNSKGYGAVARAALASCQRGLDCIQTVEDAMQLRVRGAKDDMISLAVRAAVACREFKKGADWLVSLSSDPTALNTLARADVALVYRQNVNEALALYQRAATLSKRTENAMAAHAGTAACLITLNRPTEANSLLSNFSIDKSLPASKSRRLLPEAPLRHGSLVLPRYTYLKGLVELEIGERKAAFATVAAAAKQDAQEPSTFATLGHIYMSSGDEARAIKCFEKSLGLNAVVSLPALRALSGLYVKKEDIVSCVRLYRAVIEEVGHRMMKGEQLHAEMVEMARFAWLRLGQAQYSKNKLLEAKKSFQKVVSLSNQEASADKILTTATIALADVYFGLQQYSAAQHTFESLLGEELTNSAAYIRVRLGMISLVLAETDAAVTHLQRARHIEEHLNGEATLITLWHLGHALAEHLRSLLNRHFTKRAMVVFEEQLTPLLHLLRRRLLQTHQSSSQIRQLLPELLKLHGDVSGLGAEAFGNSTPTQEPRRHYVAAVFEEPWKSERWYDLAREETRSGLKRNKAKPNLEEARRSAQCAVLLEPMNADAWNLLGVCYKAHSRKHAVHCFCQATRLSSSNGDAWMNLAEICLEQGSVGCNAARACVEQYQSVGLTSEDRRSWTMRARLYAEAGDLVAALGAAECGIAADLDANEPRHVQANACIAFVIAFFNKWKDGEGTVAERDADVPVLRSAILPLVKMHPEVSYIAALVHEFLGYYEQGIEYYQAGVEQQPSIDPALRIANCYLQLGQLEKCMKTLDGLDGKEVKQVLGECMLRLNRPKEIDSSFPFYVRAKAALLAGKQDPELDKQVSATEVPDMQRFCIKHGLIPSNVLLSQSPSSVLQFSLLGDYSAATSQASKKCHAQPWESEPWREMSVTLVQQAAPLRQDHLEASYQMALSARKTAAAARILQASAQDGINEDYFSACISSFLGEARDAIQHAQKAFIQEPWQASAKRLLAINTAQLMPNLSHQLVLQLQGSSSSEEKIGEFLLEASTAPTYEACASAASAAQAALSNPEKLIFPTSLLPILNASAHLQLARQAKRFSVAAAETITHYAAALKCLPESVEIWSEVGNYLEASGMEEESELCFRTARDLVGQSSSKEFIGIGTAMGALACAVAEHKSPKKGLEILGKASKRWPEAKELQAARAHLHLRSGQKEKADEYFAKAAGLDVVTLLRQVDSN